MTLIPPRTPGRRLMVLDDAETIARQARRRAAVQRRRREALQQLAALTGVAGIVALLMGASIGTVGATMLVLGGVLALAHRQLQGKQQDARRRRVRALPGSGIGTPRPKGGFSTTRHRSGAPVWTSSDPSRAA
jgi:hypothetical protein